MAAPQAMEARLSPGRPTSSMAREAPGGGVPVGRNTLPRPGLALALPRPQPEVDTVKLSRAEKARAPAVGGGARAAGLAARAGP
jgi:hypothetical protein